MTTTPDLTTAARAIEREARWQERLAASFLAKPPHDVKLATERAMEARAYRLEADALWREAVELTRRGGES
jgi:hypothetical protein